MDDSSPPAKPRYDSAATKRRLLAAGTAEFAQFGIAGARVDRIAAAARANKRQIYDYFGDKDGLFDAVLNQHTGEVYDAAWADADDLVAYAGRLFDYHLEHPVLVRLVHWARLEGRVTPSAYATRAASYRRRLDAIDAIQDAGRATTRLSAHDILGLIESIAVGWTMTTAEFLIGGDAEPKLDRAAQRRIVVDSVRRVVN